VCRFGAHAAAPESDLSMSAQHALRMTIERAVRLAILAGLTNKDIADLLIDVARALMRSHIGDPKIIELFPTTER
jgi:hypothetical protein